MSFSFGLSTLQKLHLIEINQFYFSWRENSKYRQKREIQISSSMTKLLSQTSTIPKKEVAQRKNFHALMTYLII